MSESSETGISQKQARAVLTIGVLAAGVLFDFVGVTVYGFGWFHFVDIPYLMAFPFTPGSVLILGFMVFWFLDVVELKEVDWRARL